MSYIVIGHGNAPSVAHQPTCRFVRRKVRQMALTVPRGAVPCRYCLNPDWSLKTAEEEAQPLPILTGSYRRVGNVLTPVACPACGESVTLIHPRVWGCSVCPWSGTVFKRTWTKVSAYDSHSGHYRIERRHGREILIATACPQCGADDLRREGSATSKRSRMWSCRKCPWLGIVRRKTWKLDKPPAKRKRASIDKPLVMMHGGKRQADRLG